MGEISIFTIAFAVIGAVIAAVAYYVIMRYYNGIQEKKEDGGVPVKKTLIGILTIISFVSLCWIGYRVQINSTGIEIFMPFIFVCGMSFLTTTDITEHRVPNKALIILLVIWFGLVSISLFTDVYHAIQLILFSGASACIAGLVFILTYFISKKRLGMGDVKLSFIMGLYLGQDRIIGAILYGTVLCCLFSIFQVLRKKLSMKDKVPMVPFLYLGSIIVMCIL